MSWGFISGLATLAAMVAFIGVVLHSYSARRQADFERMASMPLEEDSTP